MTLPHWKTRLKDGNNLTEDKSLFVCYFQVVYKRYGIILRWMTPIYSKD